MIELNHTENQFRIKKQEVSADIINISGRLENLYAHKTCTGFLKTWGNNAISQHYWNPTGNTQCYNICRCQEICAHIYNSLL